MSPVLASRSIPISLRAQRLVESPPTAEYIREHLARSEQAYDPIQRPDGYIPLCIAENRLVWDVVLAKMAACRDVPARVLGYDAMTGAMPFRERLAAFLERTFMKRPVQPEQIAVLAGAGAVLETLFYALADPGDGVLVPTPSYAGFWSDLETRDGLVIVPVHRQSRDGFRITPELLDQAVGAAGRPIKALLFTSPDNPLGRVYGREEVDHVLGWAEGAGVHVVFDEIYALSIFGACGFTSCAELRPRLGEGVHVVWAFSKDFAASGLRCGVLVSENEAVMAAIEAQAYWAACSGDTQFMLGEMIADETWVDRYVATMRSRLAHAYDVVTSALSEAGIPYLPADAGFFLLCDLRRFLTSPTWEGEGLLWRQILERANVNLTPGEACRTAEPGFMRLCFAGLAPEIAALAVRRVAAVLPANP